MPLCRQYKDKELMPEFVLFQSGSSQFAVDRKSIRQISLLAADAKKTHNRILRQTIAYQGQTLPLFDLAAALGEDTACTPDSKVIIGKLTPAAALRADCVNARLTADAAQVVDLPLVFTGTARACFSKVLLLKDHLALIVDWAGLAVIEASRVGLPGSVQHVVPCKEAAAQQGPAPTGKAELSSPEFEHSGQRSLEIIVAQKLQQFIEGSVHQMVARTMAETLQRYVGPSSRL
jgi:chemotaxis signal transduction protein